MFSPAETPMWQALRLFDIHRNLSIEKFSLLLREDGWFPPQHTGHSEIFMKEGYNLVFKLDDSKLNGRGYNKFAHRLRQPDVLVATHPHFPRIYRHRAGVTLLERLNLMSEDIATEWAYNVREILWMKGHKLSLEEDEEIAEFAKCWPHLTSALDLLLGIANSDRIFLHFSDILQRADSTPVIIDPII